MHIGVKNKRHSLFFVHSKQRQNLLEHNDTPSNRRGSSEGLLHRIKDPYQRPGFIQNTTSLNWYLFALKVDAKFVLNTEDFTKSHVRRRTRITSALF